MLRVYTYCSYRSSPVGFWLGVVEPMEPEAGEYLFPSVQKVKSAKVRKYFSGGIMKGCFGAFKERENYFCVVKSLEKEFYNKDGMPSKKYGNFAFETDQYDEYEKIAINLFEMGKDRLSDYMGQFLIPDSSVPDVALKIQTAAFKDFIRQLLKDTKGNIPDEFQLRVQQDIAESVKKKESQTNGNRKLNIKVSLGAAVGLIIVLVILLIYKR